MRLFKTVWRASESSNECRECSCSLSLSIEPLEPSPHVLWFHDCHRLCRGQLSCPNPPDSKIPMNQRLFECLQGQLSHPGIPTPSKTWHHFLASRTLQCWLQKNKAKKNAESQFFPPKLLGNWSLYIQMPEILSRNRKLVWKTPQ